MSDPTQYEGEYSTMRTPNPPDRREHLLRGLLGETHIVDYRTSAYFKSAIDALVQMLPCWVDGIARWAAENDREFQARVEIAKATPIDFNRILADLGLPQPGPAPLGPDQNRD